MPGLGQATTPNYSLEHRLPTQAELALPVPVLPVLGPAWNFNLTNASAWTELGPEQPVFAVKPPIRGQPLNVRLAARTSTLGIPVYEILMGLLAETGDDPRGDTDRVPIRHGRSSWS